MLSPDDRRRLRAYRHTAVTGAALVVLWLFAWLISKHGYDLVFAALFAAAGLASAAQWAHLQRRVRPSQ